MIQRPNWIAYLIAYGLMLLGTAQLVMLAIKLAM